MTIPTRDELLERLLAWRASGGYDADFTVAEIRRAVAEELEALRLCAPAMSAPHLRTWIDARLAALREQPKSEASMPLAGRGLERREPGSIPGAMSAGGDAGGNSGETKARASAGAHGAEESAIDCTTSPVPWKPTVTRIAPQPMPTLPAGNVAAPATSNGPDLSRHDDFGVRSAQATPGDPARLSDADVLERAAQWLREHASKLRAVPAPETVDVFDVTARRALKRLANIFSRHDIDWLANMLRDRFGPLDQLLSEIEVAPGAWQTRAAATRAALRQRAREASQ